MHNDKVKRLLVVALCAVLAIALLSSVIIAIPIASNLAVLGTYDSIREDFDGQSYDCILVLGAGLRSDGSPSDMLADRLDVAIKLYNEGVSDVILLSGDCSGEDYDEVGAMESYCIAFGVPREAIVKDGEGYSTYESMRNTKKNSDYDDILIVTQRYHLYRALYIAEQMGFSADGADASLRRYRGQLYRDVREVAARTKDFFMVMLFEDTQ